MKNENFFYLQYDKINWENQEKTKINSFVNDFIVRKFISKHKNSTIRIFDIGFGIGFFIRELCRRLPLSHDSIAIEGCEPSSKNYHYFLLRPPRHNKKVQLRTYHKTFLHVKTDPKFDFITAIYVFPHFLSEKLEETARKIHTMLNTKGRFVLVVANEQYLEEKLKSNRDLFIEKNTFKWNGKRYKEILHYSDIPKIGKLIDYNREESFYIDLFRKHHFKLIQKSDLDDNGFICTVFVFKKN